MPATIEESTKHLGESAAMNNHDRDLVQELSKRLDSLWRCDQYIANAEGHENLIKFWRDVKDEEHKRIDQIRSLIKSEINQNCF